MGSRFGVQGSGFRVQGTGCRVQGSGCRVQGAGFRVQGLLALEFVARLVCEECLLHHLSTRTRVNGDLRTSTFQKCEAVPRRSRI